MNKLDSLSGRAMDLVDSVGDGLRQAVPDRAMKWVETGAALAVMKAGSRATILFVKRNPALTAVAVAGAGVLWYVARRKARQARRDGGAAMEGTSTRVEARRASRPAPVRKRAAHDRTAASE